MSFDRKQTTLAKSVQFSGVALHSGILTTITVRPAAASTGIVFSCDLGGQTKTISASPSMVSKTKLGTTISNEQGFEVSTIEHLMAAFAICQISNAFVDIDGPEVPIMDGSARPFIDGLLDAKVTSLDETLTYLMVKEPVEVAEEDRFIRVTPSTDRNLQLTIDFEDPAIGKSSIFLNLDDTESLIKRVGAARTFCRLQEIETMRSAGLAKGGSLENAIVVDGHDILNTSGLRDQKEFVLHKALDLIGDLALIGAPLQGLITAHKSGHDLNVAFAKTVLQATETGSIVRS